jgi:hypothetical protein
MLRSYFYEKNIISFKMDFFKSLRKSKTKKDDLEEEIIRFEENNSDKNALQKAIIANDLYRKGLLFDPKTKNNEKFDEYLNVTLKYPLLDKGAKYLIYNNSLITILFYFFWLGGSNCFRTLDKRCSILKNMFSSLYAESKDQKNKIVFDPLLYFDQVRTKRNKNLETEGIKLANEGYILVTLDNEIPGIFLIVNPRGNIIKWNMDDFISLNIKDIKDLSPYEALLDTIDNARLESGPSYQPKVKKPRSPGRMKKSVNFEPTFTLTGDLWSHNPEIVRYKFEDLFLSLCDHPLMKEELADLFHPIEIMYKSSKRERPSVTQGALHRMKSFKEIEEGLKEKGLPSRIPSQINKVQNQIFRYGKDPRTIDNIAIDIIQKAKYGNQIVIYGDSPKKDIMVVLDVIFGTRNPFKMNDIITPEDFGRKPCVETFTQKELDEKIKERYTY